MLVMFRAALRGALTKNIQLLTMPCTYHAFHCDTLDVHDSPDPFSCVHEGGLGTRLIEYTHVYHHHCCYIGTLVPLPSLLVRDIHVLFIHLFK